MLRRFVIGGAFVVAVAFLTKASDPGRVGDWPMWGGTPDRNMVSDQKVVSSWDVKTGKNVKWVAQLGSQSYGNPVVAGGQIYVGTKHAKVVWKFDMMEEVGSQPHNMSNSSPVSYGDLLFVSTSNGQDESHVHIPSPKAPAIIALNKKTGKLAWEDNPVEDRILHGQWASPAVGKIGDVVQVVIGQGDGWVRGYDAMTGKRLWWFDMNPKDSVWPKTRNEVISTPVISDNKVYIANGQDPEHGEGVGHLYAIDATKRGDITESGRIWHFDKIRRSVSTGALKDGLLYYADFSGFLHALDAATGKEYWQHDMLAAVWGSPMVIGDKVYLGDEDGDVVVLQHGKEKKVLGTYNMGSSVYSTPVPANGVLFIANRNQLFALKEGAMTKPAAAFWKGPGARGQGPGAVLGAL